MMVISPNRRRSPDVEPMNCTDPTWKVWVEQPVCSSAPATRIENAAALRSAIAGCIQVHMIPLPAGTCFIVLRDDDRALYFESPDPGVTQSA